MATPTSNSDGSQTCVIDTEHTLATITTAGVYELQLDLNALANGDVLVVKVKLKVRSSGTTRIYREASYAHVQGEKVVSSLPIATANEVVFTIEQTDGTGRAIPWEILELS